jgi:hypothetical protein
MTQPRRVPTAERSIFFYRLDAGLDDDGVPVDLDLAPVLTSIDQRPFAAGPQGRYVDVDQDSACVSWIDAIAPVPQVRLATIRRTGLPHIERTGNLRPLMIADDEGVAEQIHIVLYREQIDGVWMTLAASEFNFYGPRISRFAYYLRSFGRNQLPPITFRPLLRNDISEALDHLQDIRLFSLRVSPSYFTAAADVSSTLGETFAAARAVGEADEYEIVARPKRRSRRTISERFLALAKDLTGRGDLRTGSTHFQVSGRSSITQRVEHLDLLSDKLIAKRDIVRVGENSRALDSPAAYEAIGQAYRDLYDQLVVAASALVIEPPQAID